MSIVKGGSRVGERGAEVEALQGPRSRRCRRRGGRVWEGCLLPNGEGAVPPPQKIFIPKWRISVHSAICSSNFEVRECLT